MQDTEFCQQINICVSFIRGLALAIFVNDFSGQHKVTYTQEKKKGQMVDDVLKDWGSSKLQ